MKFFMTLFLLAFSINTVSDTKIDIDKAVNLIRTLCLAGDGYEMSVDGNGNISIFKTGVKGSLRYSTSNISGKIDVPDEDKVIELENIRKCTSPHIPKLLDIVLSGNGSTYVEEKYGGNLWNLEGCDSPRQYYCKHAVVAQDVPSEAFITVCYLKGDGLRIGIDNSNSIDPRKGNFRYINLGNCATFSIESGPNVGIFMLRGSTYALGIYNID